MAPRRRGPLSAVLRPFLALIMLSRAAAFIRHPAHRLAPSHHPSLLKGMTTSRTVSVSRAAASNFGYPDAATDVIKNSVSYKEWLVDEKDVAGERVIPIELVDKSDFDAWVQAQDLRTTTFLKFQRESQGGKLKHREGGKEVIPRWDASGLSPESSGHDAIDKVVLFVKDGGFKDDEPFVLSSLPQGLPAATYRLTSFSGAAVADPTIAAFSWAMGTYKMDRYKEKKGGDASSAAPSKARLVWPEGSDRGRVGYTVEATFLARHLINMPTECMGPAQLQQVAEALADAFPGAKLRAVVGDELLQENYPQIHTVGRAAPPGNEPRLLDLTWGDADKPKVTLVGKGVMYDTGGLDIKPGNSMGAMKKDMAGAAKVLALAHMIMSAQLPVRLRVLVPSVENSVDALSYRNGDIIKARNGLTTEVITTDAEGRLVLADALVEADSEDPDLIIDAATLTGAARVAMGLEVPAFFSNKKGLGRWLQDHSWTIDDPLWQLPLYQGYRKHLKSNLADMRNTGAGGSGVITAALYLESFLQKRGKPGSAKHRATPWVHVDFNGANAAGRPGRPEGGEPQGMRALFDLVREVGSRGGWPVEDEPPATGDDEEEAAAAAP